jgi:type VI secretion system protein ImpF
LARSATETLVTQSVLDRLMAVEEWPTTRAQSLRYFKDALKRDLEWLLNTRQPPMPKLADYALAKASTINYGLPDITALGLSSASDNRRLRLAIETCLRNFEPRLSDVRVTLDGGGDTTERKLRFHIEGTMKLDPAPEEISFDTVLELSSGEYKVK